MPIRKRNIFLERWRAHVTVLSPDECWPFVGYTDEKGYGIITINGKSYKGHRVSYLAHHGTIPAGAYVLHSCDNTSCVNPWHLSLGDHAENMRQKAQRGRAPRVASKITATQAAAIRKDRRSLRRIAADYGLSSHRTVAKIKRGLIWKESL